MSTGLRNLGRGDGGIAKFRLAHLEVDDNNKIVLQKYRLPKSVPYYAMLPFRVESKKLAECRLHSMDFVVLNFSQLVHKTRWGTLRKFPSCEAQVRAIEWAKRKDRFPQSISFEARNGAYFDPPANASASSRYLTWCIVKFNIYGFSACSRRLRKIIGNSHTLRVRIRAHTRCAAAKNGKALHEKLLFVECTRPFRRNAALRKQGSGARIGCGKATSHSLCS